MKLYPKLEIDLKLAGVYLACVAFILHSYPVAQLTWDSYYYIDVSYHFGPGIRPSGYPYFLKLLSSYAWSLPLIVTCQFLLNFLSIWFFLRVIDKIFDLKKWQYYLLGILLIVEPVALYYCFNILSDILFSALSLAYVSTLVLFARKRNMWLFIAHIMLAFACIEVRQIALFYPYLSFAIMVLYHPKLKLALLYGIIIFGTNYLLMQMHIRANEERYKVSVYSAFTGWTYANNALYGLPYIKLDTNEIEDVEIRRIHAFCSTYMDTSSFAMPFVGSGFLWDDKSPLCILRKKLEDSKHVYFYEAWFLLSRVYGKYGMYLQTHFPMAYMKGFILPNIETLIHPQNGEMWGYYCTPPNTNPDILGWYHQKPQDLFVRHEIYKNYINEWNLKYYHWRLFLFVLAVITTLFYYKRIRKQTSYFFMPVILFTIAFYMLTLYSSWFMYRYLLPVIPLQAAVIFAVFVTAFRKPQSDNQAQETPILINEEQNGVAGSNNPVS